MEKMKLTCDNKDKGKITGQDTLMGRKPWGQGGGGRECNTTSDKQGTPLGTSRQNEDTD